jgi:23S rRNA-/tRNA-specific pseudouridylate synthase
MGFPILGDPQYGSLESQSLSGALGFTYQQLCAKKLSFCHPFTGAELVLESCMDVSL